MSPGALSPSERLVAMMALLAERGRLTVVETAEELAVSTATVRRDFTTLAEQQLATRTHGGIEAANVAYDLPMRYRLSPDDPRERIGAAAAALVAEGEVVGLNGGTTTAAVGRHLGSRSDEFDIPVTVVTNALNLAAQLVLRDHIVTITTGGVLRAHSYELIGPLARRSLEDVWLDWAILGVDSLSVGQGAGCRRHDESEIGSDMVSRARRIVVVAASSKLGRTSLARICEIDAVDMLITDTDAEPVAALRSAGIDVAVV